MTIERTKVNGQTTTYWVLVPTWNPLVNREGTVEFEVKITDVSVEIPTIKTRTRCIRGIPGVGIDPVARERARRFAKMFHALQ